MSNWSSSNTAPRARAAAREYGRSLLFASRPTDGGPFGASRRSVVRVRLGCRRLPGYRVERAPQLLDRHRTSEEEALNDVAAGLAKAGQDLGGLSSLADDAEIEIVAEIDDRAHDCRMRDVRGHIGYEAAVD